MSGIVALYDLRGRAVDAGALTPMVRPLARRGPDAEGVWTSGSVGLGHRMLRTTAESLTESLPLVSADGDCVISSDLRLDNRDEIADALRLSPRAGGLPDSGLVLRAYQAWGTECTKRLLGDFAFAIWDHGQRRLFCARDPFGIRPLYYWHAPGLLFACASEIKALLAHPEIPGQLNEHWVGDVLAGIRDDTESTIYRGVLRLAPGSQLIADADSIRIEKYFELTPESVPASTDGDYAEGLIDRLRRSVSSRSRSVFPVGSHLSGGLDSSTITALARDELAAEGSPPLHTYSLVYDSVAACDEKPYIDLVKEQGGIIPHTIRGDRLGPLENVDEVYDHLDEVLAAGNQHLVWALFKEAHTDGSGVRVVLDGLDGDNVISHGHNRFREFAIAGNWEAFGHESQQSARRFATATHRHNFEDTLSSPGDIFLTFGRPVLDELAETGPAWRFAQAAWKAHRHANVRPRYLFRRYGRRALVPAAILRRRKPRPHVQTPALVAPAFARRIGLADRVREAQETDLKRRVLNEGTVRGAQLAILSSPRISYALEGTSHVAGAFGLEVAHPFFDLRVVRYCLGLPSSQSYSDGWTRLVLRRALQGVLPPPIQWRVGKAWMGDNYARGLFVQDAALLDRHLDSLGPLEPFIDRAELTRLREGAESGPNDVQARLGQLATLSIWMKKKFMD